MASFEAALAAGSRDGRCRGAARFYIVEYAGGECGYYPAGVSPSGPITHILAWVQLYPGGGTSVSLTDAGRERQARSEQETRLSDEERLEEAVSVYLHRQRGGAVPGSLSSKGIWYPDLEEHQVCCDQIKAANLKRWPMALQVHCRSQKHVALLYSVPVAALRKRLREVLG